jgi:hypothetical protein
LGGFGIGLLLSAVFRVPKDADRQLGHAVMDRLDERSAAAMLAATDIHLAQHPEDVEALRKKATTLASLGDKESEGKVLWELMELVPEKEHPELLVRLIGIGQVHQVSSLRRTLLAEKHRATLPDLSKGLLLSVIGGNLDDRQRPEALLALATLVEGEEREAWLRELAERYSMHPAFELARQRGLL